MSNFLAVATVSATLRRLLQAAIGQDVSGAIVTTVRPPGSTGSLPPTGVNLYLYQVTPNPQLRNNDLPTRRSDGSLVQLPETAIDLHYLLSFHGDAGQLEPERLLGSTLRTLHAWPLVTREQIEDTLADPSYGFLAGSDLAEQVERVRIVPLGLDLAELGQLWNGVFNETEHYLSVAYRASVVLLTDVAETPKPALPVRRRQFLVLPIRTPDVDSVTDVDDPLQPVAVGSTVEITGQRLRGAKTVVRIAEQAFEPEIDDLTDTAIRFTLEEPLLSTALLRAGVQAVQVIHPYQIGTPPEDRGGAESSPAPLVIVPRLDSVQAGNIQETGSDLASADITLAVVPPVGPRQRVNLLLSSVPGTPIPQAYSIAAPARASTLSSLVIPVVDVVQGTYLVRLQVDGATSVLSFDDDPESPTYEQFTGPTVELIARAGRRTPATEDEEP